MIFRKFSRITERAFKTTIAVVIVTLWFYGGPEYGISLDGVPPVVGSPSPEAG
jgi:predicted secreted protein